MERKRGYHTFHINDRGNQYIKHSLNIHQTAHSVPKWKRQSNRCRQLSLQVTGGKEKTWELGGGGGGGGGVRRQKNVQGRQMRRS